ncbi:MAG: DUF447 family protein [Gammaproteobacteria bacterium]|jgi:hypothetical protein
MIFETIITTLNEDASTHIAPMGIRREEGRFLIAPFKPSTTLDNLRRRGEAVINLTDDVTVFAGCLTGRCDWPTRPARAVAGKVLESALAHVEVRVERIEDDETRPRFYCEAVHHGNHAPFRGFNRAQAAVIEAAILVSRLHMLPPDKIDRDMAYLQIAVDKTAGETERRAWSWLVEEIERFRKRQEEAAQS